MERLMRYKTLQCFLAALIMIAFLAPAAYASGTPDAYEASANAVSEKYIGKTVPGACVVISEHDNTVFAKGYGFADLENNTAIDPETTVFEWGSISKTFVWVSVMQLVEDRKIDLETDIRTYLPDSFLKNLRFAEPVTLLHLMNHTAGFEEELLDLRYYSASEEIPFKEVLSAHQPKQVYPPGTVSAYSNYGAALAALIVEEASGQSYKDYIKEHILLPLGMTHTSVGPFWMDVDGLLDHKAKGYSYTGKGFRREDEMHLRMYPAGAMNGTAADLLLFAEWLAKAPGEETRLFKSPETKERLFKETWCSYGANAGLSHGFWQYANHPGILGHEGGTYGFKTQFWVEPEAERAILILTNVMETDYCSAIMEAVIEQDARPPKQEVGSRDFSMLFGDYLPARSAWSYAGKIQARMQIIQISKEGEENLRLKTPLSDKDLLYEPVGEYQFYCAEAIPEERSLAFSVSDGR